MCILTILSKDPLTNLKQNDNGVTIDGTSGNTVRMGALHAGYYTNDKIWKKQKFEKCKSIFPSSIRRF